VWVKQCHKPAIWEWFIIVLRALLTKDLDRSQRPHVATGTMVRIGLTIPKMPELFRLVNYWGFQKMEDPQNSSGFNSKMVDHDLDDLELPP
jgi:hypothetical protein